MPETATINTTPPADAKREVLEYNLHIRGVWGRNRTEKREHIDLHIDRAPDAPADDETLRQAVVRVLGNLRPKPGLRWEVREAPVTLERIDHADGTTWTSRLFTLFSDKVRVFGTV